MISEHFVSTFEQVGKFTSFELGRKSRGKRLKPRTQKVGGNVVSYFCTPQNEVLLFQVGPVSGELLRLNAAWVAQTYRKIQDETKADLTSRRAWMRDFHLQQVHQASRASFEKQYKSHWADGESFYAGDEAMEALLKSARKAAAAGRVALTAEIANSPYLQQELWAKLLQVSHDAAHLVLAEMPLAKLSRLEKFVFERQAGQRFVRRTQRNDELLSAMRGYRRQQRPTLLVLSGGFRQHHAFQSHASHRQSVPSLPKRSKLLLSLVKSLADQFARLELDLQELTTLVDDLDEKPVQVTLGFNARFVIYHASGQRVSALGDEASKTQLVQALKGTLAVGLHGRDIREGSRQTTAVKDREKQAASLLRLAKIFVGKKPDVARRRLEKIVKEYTGTVAAAKAKELLAKLM